MLHQFLDTNRLQLIDRCKAKVARRAIPPGTVKLEHGVPVLIDQLIATLKVEEATESIRHPESAAHANGAKPPVTEISKTATLHGRELMKQGFTVDQVVHDYGDLCQAVTELAYEVKAPIPVEEFRTFNRCLDDAIAGAVTEFSARHDSSLASNDGKAVDDRALGTELRRHIHTATMAVAAVKAGNVGLNGATGAVLDLALVSLNNLVNRTFGQA